MNTKTLLIASIAASSLIMGQAQADDTVTMTQNQYQHAYSYQLNSDSLNASADADRTQLRQRLRDDSLAAEHSADGSGDRLQTRSQLHVDQAVISDTTDLAARASSSDRSMMMRGSSASFGGGMGRGGRH